MLKLVRVQEDEGVLLKVNWPVNWEDACPGLKRGHLLQRTRASLMYFCPVEHIAPKIEVDLTNIDVRDRVLMHDIPVQPSLKLLSENNTIPITLVKHSKNNETNIFSSDGTWYAFWAPNTSSV
uniref:Large ribosomal subunit protein bL25 beta domain-containing protein n=1 Tax=Leersia perrieri TaxID=77586 RepID=A0A0D9XLG1_9ORYZ